MQSKYMYHVTIADDVTLVPKKTDDDLVDASDRLLLPETLDVASRSKKCSVAKAVTEVNVSIHVQTKLCYMLMPKP